MLDNRLFMQYSEETITTNKQGKKEVRVLQEMGQYVKYNYLDLKTGKETSKYSIILRSESKQEHLFIVPIKSGKSLILKQETDNKKRKARDKEKKRAVTVF